MENLIISDNLDIMGLSLRKAKIILEGAVQDISDKKEFTNGVFNEVIEIQLDIVHDYIYKTINTLRALTDDLNAEREAEKIAK